MIRLERQNKRRQSDRETVDKRQLNRHKRIVVRHNRDEQHRHHRAEYRLHQKKRAGTLQVVDGAPSLGDDLRHRGKVIVKQHEICHRPRRVRSAAHGNGTVGHMQREHVVHAVSCHGDCMPLLLKRLDQLALLSRRHAPEHAAFPRHALDILVSDCAHVDASVGIRNPHGLRDVRNRLDRIAADDVDTHVLLVEILQRLFGSAANPILDEHERQRHSLADYLVLFVEILDLREHQHAPHAGKADNRVLRLGESGAALQDELRRANRIVARFAAKTDTRILVLRGKRHDPRRADDGSGNARRLLEILHIRVKRLGGLVLIVGRLVERDERVQGVVIAHPLERDDLVDVHLPGRNRNGLV